MRYLNEKLIQKAINNYSSLLYRHDFSDAKYCFEFPIDQTASINEIRQELIDDLYKLIRSVRNNTGGTKKLYREQVVMPYDDIVKMFGQYSIPFYVIYPSNMTLPDREYPMKKYDLPIPERYIIRYLNKSVSKITQNDTVSLERSLKRRSEIARFITEELDTFGIKNVTSFDFYVYELEGNKYTIYMAFNFNEEGINKVFSGRQERIKIRKMIQDRESKTKQINNWENGTVGSIWDDSDI